MQSSLYELSLLVKNKPIPEYHHEGSVFVEGRNGSEYVIRVKNNSSVQACFIVSVDGLSVLDGKVGSDESPGYVLKPWQTLDIACYKVDAETGAKFVFGSKDQSYSAEIGKGTDNVGVVAAMVFREKYVAPVVYHRGQTISASASNYGASLKSMTRSASGGGHSNTLDIQPSGIGMASGTGGWFGQGQNMSPTAESCVKSSSTGLGVATQDFMPEPEADAKLGTVFGESMQWRTQSVIFNREPSAAASLVIFYDTKKNLERRGVKFEQKVPPLPNPFPGNDTGCPVPDSWRK